MERSLKVLAVEAFEVKEPMEDLSPCVNEPPREILLLLGSTLLYGPSVCTKDTAGVVSFDTQKEGSSNVSRKKDSVITTCMGDMSCLDSTPNIPLDMQVSATLDLHSLPLQIV